MITVYFTSPIDDEQAHEFDNAEYAEVKSDYLVLTGQSSDEENICPYETVGMFLMKNVIRWSKDEW